MPWFTLPAVIAEIAVIGVVAAVVVGGIALQDHGTIPRLVAIGPTPSAHPEPDDFARGRATCKSLLDDVTLARVESLGMTIDAATVQPGDSLAEFLHSGLVCRWTGAPGEAVTFAYAPISSSSAVKRREQLIDDGSVPVAGPFERVTDPETENGGYGFGDGFWVYADSSFDQDVLRTVFARASATAIAGYVPEETSFADFTPAAKWNDLHTELTILSPAGSGCEMEIQDVDVVSPEQIVVHIDFDTVPTVCLANLYLASRTVPVPDGVGTRSVTVTIVDDFSRQYWSSELD